MTKERYIIGEYMTDDPAKPYLGLLSLDAYSSPQRASSAVAWQGHDSTVKWHIVTRTGPDTFDKADGTKITMPGPNGWTKEAWARFCDGWSMGR